MAKKDAPFNSYNNNYSNNNKFKKKEFTKSTFASRQALQEEDLVSKYFFRYEILKVFVVSLLTNMVHKSIFNNLY